MDDNKFERILIELKKYIDEKCPSELVIGASKLRKERFTTQLNFNVNEIKVTNNRTEGKIEINLIQDDNNFITIEIQYSNYKFDMITWKDFIVINKEKMFFYSLKIQHGQEDSLFEDIRNFFDERNLFGKII
jgi:hypothetical protein